MELSGCAVVNTNSGAKLSGRLLAHGTLFGTISATKVLSAHVSINVDYEKYTGIYEVTPAIEAQTLNTANRVMVEDVNIKAIPYYSVSNASHGETIIIGGNS